MNLIILYLYSIFVKAACWGRDGHEIVANIANYSLSPKARSLSSDILKGMTLAEVANWADEVSSTIPWSYSLHFINVQKTPCENDGTCAFVYERDCPDDVCVAGAVFNYTTSLESSAMEDAYVADESLRFLVHYMGDIHQPLHCSRAADMGGNVIDVTMYVPGQGSEWNLHNIWDFGLIVRSINETHHGSQNAFTMDLITQLNTTYVEEVKEWTRCIDLIPENDVDGLKACINEWVQESLQLALSEAYLNEDGEEIQDGDAISDEYYEERLLVASKRVLMSGVRLAAVIDYSYGFQS